ncbi:hypothetical protein Neosp_014586 [[Neocosmospora] mangrovei]
MAGDILTLIRRQSTPAQCYNCGRPKDLTGVFYARLAGQTEELCEDDAFYDLYQTCANCIEDETDTDNVREYVEPKLGRFVDYCASFTSLTNWATLGTASATAATTSATLATTAEDEQSSATEATSTDDADDADDSTSRNVPAATSNSSSGKSQAWIAGPVVGAVVAVLILAGVGFWWYRRRKRTPKAPSSPPDHQETTQFDKPQLHSECIPRPNPGQVVTALPPEQGHAHSYSYGEMPANEAPAYELPAEDRRRAG